MMINGMTSINKLIVSGTESILSFLALLPIIFCNSSIFNLYCFAKRIFRVNKIYCTINAQHTSYFTFQTFEIKNLYFFKFS